MAPPPRTRNPRGGGGGGAPAPATATTRRTRAASVAGLDDPPPLPLPGRKKGRRDKREKAPSSSPPPGETEAAPEPPTLPPRGKTPELVRLLDSLRTGEDLPTLYAALQLARERLDDADADGGYIPTDDESQLLQQASLAVPHLMYKKAVDLLVRPRSLGGLAFSAAKADRLVRAAFEEAGAPECCSSSMTEKRLLKAGASVVAASDARKILSKLLEVGDEARSKVSHFLASLLPPEPPVASSEAPPPESGVESHQAVSMPEDGVVHVTEV